jgi:hypothetical protein
MKKYAEPKRNRVVSIRVDDETFEWLVKLAEANTRSVSGQIEHLLKVSREVLHKTGGIDTLTVIRDRLATYNHRKEKP